MTTIFVLRRLLRIQRSIDHHIIAVIVSECSRLEESRVKKLIAGLLLLCCLITAVQAFAEVFIRIDRDDPQAWKNDLANVRFLTEDRMSGSAQFSAEQFSMLAAQLREQSQEVWIVDCRICVFKDLVPDREFELEQTSTILAGAEVCRHIITFF